MENFLDILKDQAGTISASGATIGVAWIFRNPIMLMLKGIVRKFYGLNFKNNIYIKTKNKEQFCPSCFDDKIKLVHVTKINDTCVKCPLCKENYQIVE